MQGNVQELKAKRYMNEGETWTERLTAVAMLMASVEQESVRQYWQEQFLDLMMRNVFLPNSPAIANARLPNACLSACFVLVPEDSLKSIRKVQADSISVIASGGGLGFGLSDLREAGAPVNNVQRVACGPVAVIRMLSETSNTFSQGFRKNANMAQLSVDHPDIEEFIHLKDDLSSVNNFNISVQVSDGFMSSVRDDDDWYLISRYDGNIVRTVKARDIWYQLVESAHATGDPGIVFIDRVNETAPNPTLGPIKSSNPCGEEFLESYNNCCLGSINLANTLHTDDDGSVYFDPKALRASVAIAVRFLDNLIDVNCYEVPEMQEMAQNTRRIGLGLMGFADTLDLLGLTYGSKASEVLASNIAWILTDEAKRTSEALAEERGPFPLYGVSIHTMPIRNSSVTTIAPTGTISRLAGCSSGIEPHYALVWESNILWDNEGPQMKMLDCPSELRRRIRAKCHSYNGEDQSVLRYLLKLGDINEQRRYLLSLGIESRDILTAYEVPYIQHIDILAAFQKYVTNSISKTINMPEESTVEDVEEAYLYAFSHKCKAATVYRNNSRSGQVLATSVLEDDLFPPLPVPRTERLAGHTYKIDTSHGNMYVTVNHNREGRPVECFVVIGKSGDCDSSFTETIGRLITLGLKANAPISEMVEQLQGIGCNCVDWDEDSKMLPSIPEGISRVLMSYVGGNELQVYRSDTAVDKCSDCGGMLRRQGSCMECLSCGLSFCEQ